MINLVDEAPGTWGVDLHPSTPHRITQAVEVATHGFSTFVVTPTRVDTVGLVTDAATLHSLCTYAGLLRAQSNRLALSGPGLWAALGNEQGVGPLVGAGLSDTKTLRAWAQSLDLAPFITADTSLDNTVGWAWTSDRVMTYREALESIFDAYGFPLWIDPRTMTIKDDASKRTFCSQLNRPLLTPWFDGREVGDDRPLIRATFDTGIDLDDWLAAILYTDAGGSSTTNGSNAYTHPGGVDVDMKKYISDASTPSGSGAWIAGTELDIYNEPGWSIVATCDEPDLLSYVQAGSNVIAYDPENGLYDFSASEYLARGQMIRAASYRVQTVRAPITAQNGVYIVTWDGAADVIVDLSEHFIPETGAATIELGRTRHRAIRTQARRDGARRQ